MDGREMALEPLTFTRGCSRPDQRAFLRHPRPRGGRLRAVPGRRPGLRIVTRTRLIGGLVAGAVVALVGAAAPCRAAPAPSPAPPLKVMTFNIRYGTALDGANRWSRRRPLVVGVIWTYEPAVVGLQEALRFQLDQLREELPAYDKIGVGRRDGRKAGEYGGWRSSTRARSGSPTRRRSPARKAGATGSRGSAPGAGSGTGRRAGRSTSSTSTGTTSRSPPASGAPSC